MSYGQKTKSVSELVSDQPNEQIEVQRILIDCHEILKRKQLKANRYLGNK